jgi:hypothetical protein
MCASYIQGLEHPLIWLSVGGSGTNALQKKKRLYDNLLVVVLERRKHL